MKGPDLNRLGIGIFGLGQVDEAHDVLAFRLNRFVVHLPCGFISHKVLIKSFCKSQFPHKSVNLFFILIIIKDKLTNLCGN